MVWSIELDSPLNGALTCYAIVNHLYTLSMGARDGDSMVLLPEIWL